jgi:hypothetical protein
MLDNSKICPLCEKSGMKFPTIIQAKYDYCALHEYELETDWAIKKFGKVS